MEVVIANKWAVGAILWDFSKFFDMMLIHLLVAAALRLNFPVVDLILGLEMHSAPRWLGMMGCVGGLIQPLRSVLPGCIMSIHFTRVYLMEKLHGAGGPTP